MFLASVLCFAEQGGRFAAPGFSAALAAMHCVSSAWLMALVAGMRLVLHRANRANRANRLRCFAALDDVGALLCRAWRTLRCARFGGFCRRGAALAARALREQCLAHAPWCVGGGGG